MPMTTYGVASPSSPRNLIRWPSAVPSGHSFSARTASRMATGGAVAENASCSEKVRPARSGTPMAAKYSGPTAFHGASNARPASAVAGLASSGTSIPARATALPMLNIPIGTIAPTPTAATPGWARRRRSSAARAATVRGPS